MDRFARQEGAPSGINIREAVLVGKLQKLKTIYHLFCGLDFVKNRRKCKLLDTSSLWKVRKKTKVPKLLLNLLLENLILHQK